VINSSIAVSKNQHETTVLADRCPPLSVLHRLLSLLFALMLRAETLTDSQSKYFMVTDCLHFEDKIPRFLCCVKLLCDHIIGITQILGTK
jgi:hypothetical protein